MTAPQAGTASMAPSPASTPDASPPVRATPPAANGGAPAHDASVATPAEAGATPTPDAGVAADGGSTTTSVNDAASPSMPATDAAAPVEQSNKGRMPDPKFLPAATGPCPEFTNGYVMFHPDKVDRRVLLYISDAAKTKDGPLVFSWHSTIPNPEDAVSWIGQSVINEIEAQGGLVAAPTTADPNAVRPWDSIPMGPQNTDGDQRLMDEIVACAQMKVGIDLRRIHAIGMSAGGLKTAQVSLRRSGYLASVVVYSGGLTDGDHPPDQDPTNPFAAMIMYGGATDISPVDGINYTDASNRYLDLLRMTGRFGFLCNHGGGHSVPQDSQASAWQFMQDHPFGTSPEPYANALPMGFLRYCSVK